MQQTGQEKVVKIEKDFQSWKSFLYTLRDSNPRPTD